jgi:hypothetical protein
MASWNTVPVQTLHNIQDQPRTCCLSKFVLSTENGDGILMYSFSPYEYTYCSQKDLFATFLFAALFACVRGGACRKLRIFSWEITFWRPHPHQIFRLFSSTE